MRQFQEASQQPSRCYLFRFLVAMQLMLPAQLLAQADSLPVVPPGTVPVLHAPCYSWYCGSSVEVMHGSAAITDGGLGILEVLTRTGPDAWESTQLLLNPDEAGPPQPPPNPTAMYNATPPVMSSERRL